jgi:hypothetical protein
MGWACRSTPKDWNVGERAAAMYSLIVTARLNDAPHSTAGSGRPNRDRKDLARFVAHEFVSVGQKGKRFQAHVLAVAKP